MDRIVKEAVEIKLHTENVNWEVGFLLSRTWQPVIRLLKRSPQPRIDSPDQLQRSFDFSH
jgi:hypothetical protein